MDYVPFIVIIRNIAIAAQQQEKKNQIISKWNCLVFFASCLRNGTEAQIIPNRTVRKQPNRNAGTVSVFHLIKYNFI